MRAHDERKAAAGRAGKERSGWRKGYAPRYRNAISWGPYCPIADRAQLMARAKRTR